MKKALALAALLLPFLAASLAGPGKASAQEKGRLPDQILNPLPDYDPFDHAGSPPQYFPDDVDKRAHEALVDSLTGRDDRLEGYTRFFAAKDAELRKERGTVTGLTDSTVDLRNAAIRDRQRYLEAQRQALSSASTEQEKKLIESRLRNDDLSQAEDLLRKDTANRWGGLLNRMLGSVNLLSVLSGSYVGAAVDSAVGQLADIGSSEMSVEARKALAHYLEHLRRYPDDPKNPEVKKAVELLEKQKRAFLVKKEMEKGEAAEGKGELDDALFHYQVADGIDPASSDVKRGLAQIKKKLEERTREATAALLAATTVPDHSGGRAAEKQAVQPLLDALTARDTDKIEREAKRLADQGAPGPFADSGRDASAVALEIKGEHEEAKKILERIAASSTDPEEKKRARLLLASSEYNLLKSFNDARTEHRLETAKYILLGDDFLRKNLLYSAAPLIVSGPGGASAVAAANAVIIGSHLYQVFTANPVSNQGVIDKGVEYIRNHPQSSSASEVYTVLADAYEDAGMYDKALAYHEMSGTATEQKLSGLKEKAAKRLLQAAEKSSDREAKEAYLKAILEEYPESGVDKEATSKLAALMKIDNQGLRMSKKFLMENPELYGPQGLGLKPTLFDGKTSNMELADQGVSLLDEGEILIHYQTPWGVQSRIYPIDKETSSRFQMALRQKNYEIAMGDVDARAKGSPGGIKNIPVPILKGELEKKEEDNGDTTLSLVREATGPAGVFPKVLDYQLLSESEKENGARWKLPPIQGDISRHGFDLSGSLPAGLWGDEISIGSDRKSPVAGLQLPIPYLQNFIPVDFLLQGGPGRLSVSPKIHLQKDKDDDQELYR